MNKYILFLLLVLITLTQYTLGSLLIVYGFFIPLVVFYLWLIKPKMGFNFQVVFAFTSGIIIDLMGFSYLGTHALLYLFLVGVMDFIEKHTTNYQLFSRFVSLIIILTIHLLLIGLIES
jgi:rod shape-determining protein MreD